MLDVDAMSYWSTVGVEGSGSVLMGGWGVEPVSLGYFHLGT